MHVKSSVGRNWSQGYRMTLWGGIYAICKSAEGGRDGRRFNIGSIGVGDRFCRVCCRRASGTNDSAAHGRSQGATLHRKLRSEGILMLSECQEQLCAGILRGIWEPVPAGLLTGAGACCGTGSIQGLHSRKTDDRISKQRMLFGAAPLPNSWRTERCEYKHRRQLLRRGTLCQACRDESFSRADPF